MKKSKHVNVKQSKMIFPKIKNVIDLRNFSIELLEGLSSKRLEMEEVGVAAKVVEGIMSSLKTEMAYHAMCGNKPRIEFLEGSDYQEIKNLHVKRNKYPEFEAEIKQMHKEDQK